MVTTAAARAAATARKDILDQLRDDHSRVKKAYRDFRKLDLERDPAAGAAIVREVLDELTVHAALEEEFLYPAARGEVDDALLDAAEVEHDAMRAAIDQLRAMPPGDAKVAARFGVLCDAVLHHVEQEEGVLFAQLERTPLEWEALAQEMDDRRESLLQDVGAQREPDTESGPVESGPTGAGVSVSVASRAGSG
jgi:hemerythrin superfamily protein